MKLRKLGILAGLGLAAVLGPVTAHADAPEKAKDPPAAPAARAYSTELLVLHATNAKKGIDPRIGDMPELKKIPFSSYDSYELVQKVKVPLKKDEPKTFDLPNGRVLQTK